MIDVLFSSGIDSWACLNWAVARFGKENVRPVYIDVGQRYASKEIVAAVRLCATLGLLLDIRRIDKKILHEDDAGHISLRNTFFLLLIAKDEDSEGVVFGMIKGDSPEDKNPRYVRLMQKLFDSQFAASIYRKHTKKFKIYTPFSRMTKTEIVSWILKNAKASAGLSKTIGCFSDENNSCGACISCFNRWVSFTLNKVEEDRYSKMYPFDWMIEQMCSFRNNSVDRSNSYFKVAHLWNKRYWIIDSWKAMNQCCIKDKDKSFLLYLIHSRFLKKVI